MEGRNSLNRYGATPFFLAAKSLRRPDDAGAAGSRRGSVLSNVDGDTPLMVAAGVGVYSQGESPGQPEESAEAVKLLLELGAPVSHVDKERRDGAARPGLERIERGGDAAGGCRREARCRNKRGWLPLTIADGVYYNARVMMNLHTAKLLRDLMVARGLDASQAGINTNGQRPDQSGAVQGNIVVDDLTDAQNPSEVQEKLRAEMRRREEALRLIQQDRCP